MEQAKRITDDECLAQYTKLNKWIARAVMKQDDSNCPDYVSDISEATELLQKFVDNDCKIYIEYDPGYKTWEVLIGNLTPGLYGSQSFSFSLSLAICKAVRWYKCHDWRYCGGGDDEDDDECYDHIDAWDTPENLEKITRCDKIVGYEE